MSQGETFLSQAALGNTRFGKYQVKDNLFKASSYNMYLQKMRESYSLELQKTIYERTAFPSHGGGLERAFLEFIDCDAEVECFVKINEFQHRFASIFYLRTDGLLATYHPDFLVRTKRGMYVVETKGDDKKMDANVQQKRKAAVEWCKKINELSTDQRQERKWEYILLDEGTFYALSKNGACFEDICKRAVVSMNVVQGTLF